VQLQDGATLTTSGDLANSGYLLVNNGGSGGSSLTLGGTLSNSNNVQVGDGALATTVTAKGLSNTGTISIEGGSTNQAVLDITGASAPATWTGTLDLSGDALLEYSGAGGISTIASGAQINIDTSQGFSRSPNE
jgi:hypothetical protein